MVCILDWSWSTLTRERKGLVPLSAGLGDLGRVRLPIPAERFLDSNTSSKWSWEAEAFIVKVKMNTILFCLYLWYLCVGHVTRKFTMRHERPASANLCYPQFYLFAENRDVAMYGDRHFRPLRPHPAPTPTHNCTFTSVTCLCNEDFRISVHDVDLPKYYNAMFYGSINVSY